MTVTVKRVATGRGLPTAADVIDYAIALVEEYGWNAKAKDGVKSGEAAGFTLHDSIGEACTRLSAAVEPQGSGQSGKDWVARDAEGNEREMRSEAQQYVTEASRAALKKKGKKADVEQPDVALNDLVKSADEVLAVLREAKRRAAA